MTDPLGQSQVIPYLNFLARAGYKISLISFEKETAYQKSKDNIESLLKSSQITWIPLQYTKWPPVLSTIWDIIKLNKTVFKLYKNKSFDIIHCRSYISAIAGLKYKKKFNSFFIFDMRGFWADERVDGKIWNLRNPLYSLIYRYFKRLENKFLNEADHIVVLTNDAKKIITSWPSNNISSDNISVIPCSVDMKLFNYNNVDASEVSTLRKELKIDKDDFVLSYIGSIGTWYMLPEMLEFFTFLKESRPNSKFLFLTKDDPNSIYKESNKLQIAKEDIIVKASERNNIPTYLNLCHASIFFIIPCFSKRASSPTKQGELMSMGIPIICNSGIGDTDLIIHETDAGIVIKSFTEHEYKKAVKALDYALNADKEKTRIIASKYYNLDNAAASYLKIYKMANKN